MDEFLYKENGCAFRTDGKTLHVYLGVDGETKIDNLVLKKTYTKPGSWLGSDKRYTFENVIIYNSNSYRFDWLQAAGHSDMANKIKVQDVSIGILDVKDHFEKITIRNDVIHADTIIDTGENHFVVRHNDDEVSGFSVGQFSSTKSDAKASSISLDKGERLEIGTVKGKLTVSNSTAKNAKPVIVLNKSHIEKIDLLNAKVEATNLTCASAKFTSSEVDLAGGNFKKITVESSPNVELKNVQTPSFRAETSTVKIAGGNFDDIRMQKCFDVELLAVQAKSMDIRETVECTVNKSIFKNLSCKETYIDVNNTTINNEFEAVDCKKISLNSNQISKTDVENSQFVDVYKCEFTSETAFKDCGELGLTKSTFNKELNVRGETHLISSFDGVHKPNIIHGDVTLSEYSKVDETQQGSFIFKGKLYLLDNSKANIAGKNYPQNDINVFTANEVFSKK